MKTARSSTKTRSLIRSIPVAAAILLPTAWLCRAGELSYLETFDAYPYPCVATNLHASYADWPNCDLGTALSNGVPRAWATFPPHDPTNPIASIRSLVFGGPGGHVGAVSLLSGGVGTVRWKG